MGKIVFIFGQLLNKGYFYGELIFIFFKASINSLFNKFYLKQKWTYNSEFQFIAVLVHAISKHLYVCVCVFFFLVSKLRKKITLTTNKTSIKHK